MVIGAEGIGTNHQRALIGGEVREFFFFEIMFFVTVQKAQEAS
jgi:hypothetical protein